MLFGSSAAEPCSDSPPYQNFISAKSAQALKQDLNTTPLERPQLNGRFQVTYLAFRDTLLLQRIKVKVTRKYTSRVAPQVPNDTDNSICLRFCPQKTSTHSNILSLCPPRRAKEQNSHSRCCSKSSPYSSREQQPRSRNNARLATQCVLRHYE